MYWFESSVNSDGTQTSFFVGGDYMLFESSVNSDGTQTNARAKHGSQPFESSVNSDGTQTNRYYAGLILRLRAV